MEASYEITQETDGTFSVRHVDNHTIATLNDLSLTGLDENTANRSMDELELALLKMANGSEFDSSSGMV